MAPGSISPCESFVPGIDSRPWGNSQLAYSRLPRRHQTDRNQQMGAGPQFLKGHGSIAQRHGHAAVGFRLSHHPGVCEMRPRVRMVARSAGAEFAFDRQGPRCVGDFLVRSGDVFKHVLTREGISIISQRIFAPQCEVANDRDAAPNNWLPGGGIRATSAAMIARMVSHSSREKLNKRRRGALAESGADMPRTPSLIAAIAGRPADRGIPER